MGDEEILQTITRHDEVLKSLAKAVEHLANASTNQNTKLDKVLSNQSDSKVIMEKFLSLDRELKDTFKRIHKRIDKLEEAHEQKGCPVVQMVKKDVDSLIAGRNWIVRITIGAVLLAVLSLVIVKA